MRFKIMLVILLLSAGCQIDNSETTPWSELSWLNQGSVKVIVESSVEEAQIRINYFNKSTREKLERQTQLSNGDSETVGFKIFRPELVTIVVNGKSNDMYLIPNKDMEITIRETLQLTGKNKQLYEFLFEIGDHAMEDEKFASFMSELDSELPTWLAEYVTKSRELKKAWKIYHTAGYQQFSGLQGVSVSLKDSLHSEELLKNSTEGLYHNYFSLLQNFKYGFDFMNANDSLQEELVKYSTRKNLFEKIERIEDVELRSNLLSIHMEGSLIRKRKDFYLRDKVIAEGMRLLGDDYALRLNSVEKEYTDQNYDKSKVIGILSEETQSRKGVQKPLGKQQVGFKLLKFWFAGCAPCKKQIPYENELLEKHENVEIFHFCYSTSKERWREYIVENTSMGQHYFLSEDSYKNYKRVFKLGYAPRYILLDENNDIVCWECGNPSSKEIGEILQN